MATTKWVLDPTHSEIQFKIKHLMITNVTGGFTSFDVNASTEDEDFSKASVSFNAKVNSINTNNEQRDGHLKSGDFFDAENFPEISFSSNQIVKSGDDNFKVPGTLTIKGVSQPVTLEAEFGGITKDPYGNTKAGFSINTKINRKDFGLTWNAALETGGVMVSEDVRINAEIQLVKQ
jgi:polyisoprenoid-binding protein YceI